MFGFEYMDINIYIEASAHAYEGTAKLRSLSLNSFFFNLCTFSGMQSSWFHFVSFYVSLVLLLNMTHCEERKYGKNGETLYETGSKFTVDDPAM